MPNLVHYGWSESTAALRGILGGAQRAPRIGRRRRKAKASRAAPRRKKRAKKGKAHMVKGSAAAKKHMAKLRSMAKRKRKRG